MTNSRKIGGLVHLTAEDVAYWYLRLNGFLLLRNFLVHGDRRGDTRTEIDILGVRFPHRQEHLANPMSDDDWIGNNPLKTLVVFCDAKASDRDFNDAWFHEDRKVMESFLSLVGASPESARPAIASQLYKCGRASDGDTLYLNLLLNSDPERRVAMRWPQAQGVQIKDALTFIFKRFSAYKGIKLDHGQWNLAGHSLWDEVAVSRTSEEFALGVMRKIGAKF